MIFLKNLKCHYFVKILVFSVILIGHNALFCMGSESIKSLDFSGDGPIFLSNKQIMDDLKQARNLFRDNYVRHPIFENNGRIYPAKDAFMNPKEFEDSYEGLNNFIKYIDPKFSSSFWRRVNK